VKDTPWLAVPTLVLSCILGLGAGAVGGFLGVEAVRVALMSPDEARLKYFFGAAHYGSDWVYRSPAAYVANSLVWSVLLCLAAVLFVRGGLKTAFRPIAIALIIAVAFVAETLIREQMGE